MHDLHCIIIAIQNPKTEKTSLMEHFHNAKETTHQFESAFMVSCQGLPSVSCGELIH